MANYKPIVVDLDIKRAHEEALFYCLHEDCQRTFMINMPKRKNMCEGIVCPKCKRDFFLFWAGEGDDECLYINHGKKRRKRT